MDDTPTLPNRARTACATVLPSAILLLPALVERAGAGVEDESLRLPLVLVVLALALAFSRGSGARTPRTVFALALCGALPLLLRAVAPWSTIGSPWTFLALVGGVLLGPSVFGDAKRRADAETGLGIAAVLAAAWVVRDALEGRPPIGPLGRAGVAGPTLAALLPFAALLARRLAGRHVLLRAAPAALVFVAIVLTESRTGLAAGALGLLVTAGLAAPAPSPWRRRLLACACGLAVLGTAALGLSLAGALPGGSWIGRTDTVRVRVGLARASATLISEQPLLGHGAYGFPAEVLRIRDPDEARISAGRRPLAAHDDYLHAAVEGGLLAGLALLALVVLSIARAIRAGDAAAAGAMLAIGVSALAEDPFLASFTAALFGLLSSGGNTLVSGQTRNYTVRFAVAVVLVLVAGLHVRGLFLDGTALLREGSFRADESRRVEAYRTMWGDLAVVTPENLLAWDPGATEVRLDLAEMNHVMGHVEYARRRLEEARRFDPTRYDIPLRLGHVLLGNEPPPSKAAPPADPLPILRLYNDAEALDPTRFETHVARARVFRRLGDLTAAAFEIDAAKHKAGLVGETLVESFRLAEAQKAPPSASVAILALGLAASGPQAMAMRVEIERFLDAGEAEEKTALERAQTTLAPDFAAADRDFDAAARRLAGLVLSEAVDSRATVLYVARKNADAGRNRRALARYRALFADDYSAYDADLAFEAAKVAGRVDRGLAAQWGSRARTLIGFEALEKGKFEDALRDFKAAVSKDAGSAPAHYGLARVLARMGKPDGALPHLREAVALDPVALDRAKAEPDLASVVSLLPAPAPVPAPAPGSK